MSYTPVICEKAETVTIQACLRAPFVGYTVFATSGTNFNRVLRDNATGAFLGYGSYIDNGTDQSFFTDQSDHDAGSASGYYTGSKFMTATKSGTDFLVGYVDQAYTDPDDTTAPSLTSVNIGNGGSAAGSVQWGHLGPSEAGGDRVSWLEGRTGTVHHLTATTSALTRQQAFPLDAGEAYTIMLAYTYGWRFDGTNFWMLSRLGSGSPNYSSAPFKLLLIRWKPTTVGDPYDYEKFEIAFDDDDLNDLVTAYGTSQIVAGDTHMLSVYVGPSDHSTIGRQRYLVISKDGTSYTEYVIRGDPTIDDFAFTSVPSFTRHADGSIRLIGWAFDGSDYATGTYDLICSGETQQAAAYAETIQRKAPLTQTITGNLIPSGDMNSGSDRLLLSGDAGPGALLWQDMIDGR